VDTVQLFEEDKQERSPETLGDVLYGDNSKTLVSEKEWVGLVDSITAGDQLALHALYERSHRVVFTLIFRIVSNRETAEEVTLDVYHDVWRRASRYDATSGTVLGWIMNQARSRAIDRLRFEQRKKRVEPEPHDALLAIDLPDYRDVLELKERSRAMRDALTVLTAGEREAIESAFFSELTYAEVAARLNQPLGTIKTRIRSGLQKLRQAMAEGAKKP
jgi:RNA polymerase sigma-70 factor (ECF subfamily)